MVSGKRACAYVGGQMGEGPHTQFSLEPDRTLPSGFRVAMGLVVRCWPSSWRGWSSHVSLVGVGLVLGVFGSVLETGVGRQIGNWWHYGFWGQSYRHNYPTELAEILFLACLSLAMCVWCWASGLFLGFKSGRFVRLVGLIFLILLTLPSLALLSGQILIFRGQPIVFHSHPRILKMALGAVEPFLLLVSVILPAILGIVQGSQQGLPRLRQALGLALTQVVFILIVLTIFMANTVVEPTITTSTQRLLVAATSVFLCCLVSLPIGWLIATVRRDRHGA
jgi:hypothetical protein